jgi:hypothetical protein
MSYRLLPALFAAVSMLGAQAPPGGVWKDARFQALLNSRPAAALVADDELLAPNAASARQGLETLKGDGFALVYLPAPRTIQVKLPRFPSTAIYAWWFDPRAKTAQPAGTCDNDGVRTFTPPPAKGPAGEWVLVLDDLFRTFPPPGQSDGAPRLVYHPVRLDGAGGILPWFGSTLGEAYDFAARKPWEFWHAMRQCANGVPYYLQHQVWRPDKDDARGIGGDQIPMALTSWTLLYGYTGDAALQRNVVEMADYWLDHGVSPATAPWASLPYPYNLDVHSGRYDGDMRAGKGFVQPDKAASFGAELIVLYKMTGNRRYLDAARRIAETLAARVQPGDADNSPWPFRVHAVTNEVHSAVKDGKTFRASYTTNYTGALRLFDDLIALRESDAVAFGRARGMVAAWLKQYPLRTNKWGPFFEDIPTEDYSDTEINADTMAAYILEHPAWDANWRAHARSILDWTGSTFDNHEFARFGVTVTNEQTAYQVPGNSHSTRHAATMLLYAEKTGDLAQKADAIRRLNWATYTVDDDGKNRYIRDDVWLTDGYGDYVRHYLRAMAAFPELAPADQNHLLRTSSVLQSIEYGVGAIRYTKFDVNSEERLRMGAWTPARIEGGEMHWDPASRVLTVKSTAARVAILKVR